MQTALLSSLPDGTRVIYMSPASSPVFQIRFCQRLSSKHGEAPIKTLPRDCWRYAAKGYPCSCGTITYIGSPFSFTPSPPPPLLVPLVAVLYRLLPNPSLHICFPVFAPLSQALGSQARAGGACKEMGWGPASPGLVDSRGPRLRVCVCAGVQIRLALRPDI